MDHLDSFLCDVQVATLEQTQAQRSKGARESAGVAPGDLESALSRLKAEIWTEERSEVGHAAPSMGDGRSQWCLAVLGQEDGQPNCAGWSVHPLHRGHAASRS